MLARLQRLIVFTLLLANVAWVLAAVSLGHPGWIAAGLLVVAGGYAAVLGLEFWWLRRSHETGSADRPRAGDLLSSWWAETLVAPRVFLWRQPFRSQEIPDFLPPDSRGRHGVVLLHGFFCNRGLWNPWMRGLRGRGIAFVAPSLEPVFGSIDHYVEQIEDAVRRLEAATGRPPVLVAHSMGGLAARAWLVRSGSAARVHRIVTIGTPHQGTWMARHGRTTNGVEMRLSSPWLEALGRAEDPALQSRFTCFWGHCDNIVFPTRNGTLPAADNRHLPATPHVAMTYHPEVFDEVLRLVEHRG